MLNDSLEKPIAEIPQIEGFDFLSDPSTVKTPVPDSAKFIDAGAFHIPGKPGRKKGGKNSRKKKPLISTPDKPDMSGGAEFPDFGNMTGDALPGGIPGEIPGTGQQPNYEMLSRIMFDMSISSATILLGDEWQPENKDERDGVCQALAVYLESKDVRDIPAGGLLALVIMTYSAKRFTKPKTKSKIRTAAFWLKEKFKRKTKMMPFQRKRSEPVDAVETKPSDINHEAGKNPFIPES